MVRGAPRDYRSRSGDANTTRTHAGNGGSVAEMGACQRPHPVTDGLISKFPGLAQDGYRETSPATWDYNCIAWAASDDDQWWEPPPHGFWPPGVPPAYTLAAYTAAYATLCYQPCR